MTVMLMFGTVIELPNRKIRISDNDILSDGKNGRQSAHSSVKRKTSKYLHKIRHKGFSSIDE